MRKKDNFLSYSDFCKSNKIKNINKTAIITGGLGRIGSVFTSSLLNRGFKVICMSRHDVNYNLYKKKLPTKIKKLLSWQQIDLTKTDTIPDKVHLVMKKIKKIDILINCASSGNRGENFQYNKKNLEKEFDSLIAGDILITENILKYMRKRKKGLIINVSSLWGIVAPNFKTYLDLDIGPSALTALAKAGITNYTKYIASRDAKYLIRANNLHPGFFPRKGPVERKDYIKSICEKIPLNRIGKLNDLISAVEFLTSENSNYITGQSIVVDGGYTIL